MILLQEHYLFVQSHGKLHIAVDAKFFLECTLRDTFMKMRLWWVSPCEDAEYYKYFISQSAGIEQEKKRTLLFCITQIVCILGFLNFTQVEISVVWKRLFFFFLIDTLRVAYIVKLLLRNDFLCMIYAWGFFNKGYESVMDSYSSVNCTFTICFRLLF